jgi:repressor LexA
MKSTKGADNYLIALEKKGYIKRQKNRSRGITILSGGDARNTSSHNKDVKVLPVVDESDAHNLVELITNLRGSIFVDNRFVEASGSIVAFAGDDGMSGDGIFKGDYVIVRPGTNIQNGKTVVAIVNGQILVRVYNGVNQRVQLDVPASDRRYYDRLVLNGTDDSWIVGEVVAVMRKIQ